MNPKLTGGARLFAPIANRVRSARVSARRILVSLAVVPAVLAAASAGQRGGGSPGGVTTLPAVTSLAGSPVTNAAGAPWSELSPPAECGTLAAPVSPAEAARKLFPPRMPHIAQATLLRVLATAYSSAVEETDDSPGLTATNAATRQGIIALSRDLLREFTPGAPFGFGDHVEIPGVGRFVVEDTMSPRYAHRVDIWCPTRDEAMAWGTRHVHIRATHPRKVDAASQIATATPKASG